MFKRRGGISVQKPALIWSQALVALFSSERANSYATLETRRGNSQFKVVESLGILLIQGKIIQGGTQINPPIHQQKEHLLFGEGGRQPTSYCVPVLSQFFYYTPTSGPLLKKLSSNCYRGRHIKMEHGTNVISPLRHIAHDTMLEGIAIQVVICRPCTVFTRAKQASTRHTRGPKRTQVKLWILFYLEYFTSRVESAILEDMSTESVTSAFHEILSTQGWRNKRISLDLGSSLVPAIVKTSKEIQEIADEEEDVQENTEELDKEVEVTLVIGLCKEGWTVRTPYATSSWQQAKVESSIKTVKRCFKASEMPGTVPLTIVSFSRTLQMCASLMNTGPIVIMPPSLSDPDKLMTVSPSSLHGPSESSWPLLSGGGDYQGQQALQASLLKRFRKHWKLYYAQRLRKN